MRGPGVADDVRTAPALGCDVSAPRREDRMSESAVPPEEHATPEPELEPAEGRADRRRRHGQRARLYLTAFALVTVLVVVIALTLANTRRVELSWVVGKTRASLVWIIL